MTVCRTGRHVGGPCVCTEASVLVLVVAVITCIASFSVAFVVVAVCRRFTLSLSLSALFLATARHQTWNWVTGSPGQWVIWVIFHVRVTHRVIKVWPSSMSAVHALSAWLATASQVVLVYQFTHTHPYKGPFSGTTRVSRYQKGKTNLDFTEAQDSEWQWHQLGHMQVCTSLQTDNHASTPPLSFLQAGCPSCCQPTASKH